MVDDRPQFRHAKTRRGLSLVEMVCATAIVVGFLVPALSVMRDSLANSRDMNYRNVLSLYASMEMETALSYIADDWSFANNSYVTNNPSPDGYAAIRVELTASDDPLDGGLTGQLCHVQIVAYNDLNSNNTHDADEPAVQLRTKIARLNSYENEPT